VNTKAMAISKQKQKFERIVLTKAQALEMFKENPFKV
jgi:threonyl-tRNA synthetase